MILKNLPYVFIGGCPRSGTSALVRTLNFDKRLFICHELHLFERWSNRLNPALYKRGVENGWLSRLCKKRNISVPPYGTGRSITKKLVASLPQGTAIGDKVPREYLYGWHIYRQHFPKAKLIVCLRDGRAVIASQIRKYHQEKVRHDWAAPDVITAQELWLTAAAFLTAVETFPDIHIVKYEEAVKDPEKMVNKIGHFLGIGDLDITGHHYRPVHLESWKEELPDIEMYLTDQFKMYLDYYGYK